MRWFHVTVVLALLLAAGCRQQTRQSLPVPVWGTDRVQVGERAVAPEAASRAPALPSRSGVIVVETLGVPEGYGMTGNELRDALRQWLEAHGDVIAERMGERCDGRPPPCFRIVDPEWAPAPENPDYVVGGAIVEYDPYAEGGAIVAMLRMGAPTADPVEVPLSGETLEQMAARFFAMLLPPPVAPVATEPRFEERRSRRVVGVQRREVPVWR